MNKPYVLLPAVAEMKEAACWMRQILGSTDSHSSNAQSQYLVDFDGAKVLSFDHTINSISLTAYVLQMFDVDVA